MKVGPVHEACIHNIVGISLLLNGCKQPAYCWNTKLCFLVCFIVCHTNQTVSNTFNGDGPSPAVHTLRSVSLSVNVALLM